MWMKIYYSNNNNLGSEPLVVPKVKLEIQVKKNTKHKN